MLYIFRMAGDYCLYFLPGVLVSTSLCKRLIRMIFRTWYTFFFKRGAYWFPPVFPVTPGYWPWPWVMSNGLGSNQDQLTKLKKKNLFKRCRMRSVKHVFSKIQLCKSILFNLKPLPHLTFQAYNWLFMLMRYLLCQNKVIPNFFICVVCCGICALLHYVLLFQVGMGIRYESYGGMKCKVFSTFS